MVRIFLLVLALVSAASHASDVPRASNLGADGAEALAGSKPVVVLFSASYCAWCTAVKSEFFRHLESDPRYASRILVREVEIDSSDALTNFSGESSSHVAFARNHGVRLVPTVGFFDGQGNALAEPMVGVPTMDYYGWYLDQRIQNAFDALDPATDTEREPG